MGGLTGKPGTRAKTSGEAAGNGARATKNRGSSRRSRSLTRLRRDCRGSLPISPTAARLVLARLSRPPKPPATQAIVFPLSVFSGDAFSRVKN